MKAYSKLLVSLAPVLVAVLVAVIGGVEGGHVTTVEVIQAAIAVTTALSVWAAGYLPAGLVWPKTALAAVGAGLSALAAVVGAGGLAAVTPAEWLTVVVAVAGALGVHLVPTALVARRVAPGVYDATPRE